ncbi:MAG: MFS transporter [Candidatus Micrarchaeaceae archaeon]
MYTIVPINVISSGLSVLIPLYILSLHGNVVDVGLAIALYNLAVVPASLIWGKLTDMLRANKPFIVFSSVATIPILLALIIFKSVATAYLGYSIYAVAAAAAAPAINILVMGSKRSRRTPQTYSRYATFTLAGSLIAYAAGAFLDGTGLLYYLWVLVAFNVLAVAMALILIKEPRETVYVSEKEMAIASKSSPILNVIAPKSPHSLISTSFMKRLYSKFRIHNQPTIYVLLAAIGLFALGYNLFNTSFIPYLASHGLAYGRIFIINIANSLGQILILALVALRVHIHNINRYYTMSSVYRSTGYAISLIAIVLPVYAFFVINLVAYLIAGFAFAGWSISSSVLLYDRIRGAKQGYYIGIWTAVLGCSSVIGSVVSGFISADIGYVATFILAIAITLVSGYTFERSVRSFPASSRASP